ncbi:MAG: fibronectin type III domain-containing protein [Clostridia bacterium]|nr:fibronectin type III domain-containing protein [Clostridia bacterium]
MKKILAIICALSVMLCMLASATMLAGAAGTYTKVYETKFLNEAGDGEYTVNPTDEAFPSWIQKNKTQFTPIEDPSNFQLPVGMKYTNPSADGQCHMYFSPVENSKVSGWLIRIKSDSTTDFKLPLYTIYKSGGNMLQRYQWGYVNWYTLEKGNTKWTEAPVEGYSPTFKAGFDGYLYIPFDTLKNNGSTTMADTDIIHGLIAWKGNGFTTLDMSLPLLVDRATLGADKLPTTDKIVMGDKELTYFEAPAGGGNTGGGNAGAGVGLPAYDGEAIDYGALDIMKITDMPIYGDLKVGEKIGTDTILDFKSNQNSVTALQNPNPMSGYPLIKSEGRVTGYEGADSCIVSIYADGNKATGAEGIMMYVKMPEDSAVTTVEIKGNFYAGGNLAKSRSWWQYGGKCWLLPKGESKWQETQLVAYSLDLPAGFEGFILMDSAFWGVEGQESLTKEDAIKQINLYIPGWSGDALYFATPWIVNHIGGRTTATYLGAETKCARNLFDGSVVKAEDLVQVADDVKVGDKFDILPDSTTDKVINDPDSSDYTDTDVTVTWEATEGAASYKVELYSKTFTPEGNVYTAIDVKTATGTSATLTGMEPDTSYSVVVRAIDALGQQIAIYDSITVINSGDDDDDFFDDDFFGEDGFEDGFDDEDGFGDDSSEIPTTGDNNVIFYVIIIFMLGVNAVFMYPLAKKKR